MSRLTLSRLKKWPLWLLVFILLSLIMLMILVPVIWMTLCAFKPQTQIIRFPPRFFPESLTLDNFASVFKRIKLSAYIRNSLIYALGTTIPSLFINSLAGYAFARMEFRGKNVLFIMTLATMMIPFQVIMVPLFLGIYNCGLYDTYGGLILPKVASAISIFMMRAAFAPLPVELEEAARIDGLSEFGIYWKIMLPQVKPALITLAILGINNAWNDLLWPLLVTSRTEMRTLTNGLALFVGENTIQYGAAFAGAFISIIPMLLVYLFGQKYFVEGTATTGLK